MAYTSQYDQKVNDLYGKIENREPFVYNAADDQLYQQYVDRYQNMGRKAMMDTVGQGAALTGGYTNSYAQNVGQQAYDEYLQGLNDKLMETYQLAYGQYKDQGQDMYNLFNAAGTLAGNDFDRYMQEANMDFNREQFDWSKQMQQAQLDLQREQFEWQKANSGRSGGGGGGGGSSKTKTGDEDESKYGQIELITPGGASYYVKGKIDTPEDVAALQAKAQQQQDWFDSQWEQIWYRNS